MTNVCQVVDVSLPCLAFIWFFMVFFFFLVFEVLFVGREGGDLTDDLPSSPGTVSLMK